MARRVSKRATAKVFNSGRSQAVRIPKEYRFNCEEVFIEREGERIILTPRPRAWRDYLEKAQRFSADYPEDIDDAPPQQREKL